MARYADKYDPDLASAFQKLEAGLPTRCASTSSATPRRLSQRAASTRRSTATCSDLTRAWAERRVVELPVRAGALRGPSASRAGARCARTCIEPSLQTHALYLIGWDETRDAMRTFKVERIRDLSLTPRTFEPPEAARSSATLRRAWDIIADQPATEVVLRFAPSVAARVRRRPGIRARRSARAATASLIWRARVAGTIEIRLWILSWGDEVEVLAPPELRERRRGTPRARAIAQVLVTR